MNRRTVRTLLLAGVVAGVVMATSQANAGWGHLRGYYAAPYVGWSGYSYSYYGGWGDVYGGCCGPTYTAYVPTYSYCDPCYTPACYRGGGLLSRLAYRCRTRHHAYYWRGYDPCATSCCSICGYDDCGCGVSSGAIYSDPAIDMSPTPAEPPADDSNLQVPEKQTSLTRDSALLTVRVPDSARVLVNGIATSSTGDLRRYVSRNLTPGFDYTYEVKAEVTVDGEPVTQTKTVQLRAGQQTQLAFDLQASAPIETALTLHVPANAEVYLAGNQTKGTGPVRTFRTTKLPNGQSWAEYEVRVVVNENGINSVREEKITLRAGDQRELTFDFGVDKVASVR